eukprot:2208050-Lingulodinium_polyedra.AAC.1
MGRHAHPTCVHLCMRVVATHGNGHIVIARARAHGCFARRVPEHSYLCILVWPFFPAQTLGLSQLPAFGLPAPA